MTAIHPNTPPRLVKAFQRAGSYQKLARARRVNVSYVHDLMTKGIEPSDATQKGRDVRAKLYLPRRKRTRSATAKKSEPVQPHHKWWHALHKSERDILIKQLHDLNKDVIRD